MFTTAETDPLSFKPFCKSSLSSNCLVNRQPFIEKQYFSGLQQGKVRDSKAYQDSGLPSSSSFLTQIERHLGYRTCSDQTKMNLESIHQTPR